MPIFTDVANWFCESGPQTIAALKPAAAGITDTMWIVVGSVKETWFEDTFALIGKVFNDVTDQSATFGQFVANTFTVVKIALLVLKDGFEQAFNGIAGAFVIVTTLLSTFAQVAERVFYLDFTSPKGAWKAGLQDIETELQASA